MYNFKFAGSALSELYAVCTKTPDAEVAEYDGKYQDIPGKSGDEFIDNKRYKNVEFTREVGFVDRPGATPQDLESQFISWLAYHQNGYFDFEDTDHPGMVVKAGLKNFKEVQRTLRVIHRATLKFTREPFWYSKSGLESIVLDSQAAAETGIILNNPYPAAAELLIDVKIDTTVASSSGAYITLKVGSYVNTQTYNTLGVSSTRDHIIYDVAKQEVKSQNAAGTDVRYASIFIPPALPQGETEIKISAATNNSILSMSITPRFRSLI